MLSICCITYNHEKFISHALDSFLMQMTTFDFEVVVGEDCSTDKTLSILEDYRRRFPEKIRIITSDSNIGMQKNFVRTLKECKGKYIALCEGDDYWTDSLKLQKQVDFLEANPEYVVCYHDAKIIDEDGNLVKESKLPDEYKRDSSQEELMKGFWILTLSMCFRNVIKEYPQEFYYVPNGDTFLTSLLGEYGNGKFLYNIEKSVYRIHRNSVWSSLSEEKKTKKSFKTYILLCSHNIKKGNIDAAQYYMKKISDIGIMNHKTSDNLLSDVEKNRKTYHFFFKYKKLLFPCVKFLQKIRGFLD